MTPAITFDRLVLQENIAPVGRVVRRRKVLDNATLHIPVGHYLMGGDEVDRRCVVDLIVGRRNPASGSITRSGSCSYAIGRTGPFAVAVKGEDMVRFLSDLYRFDARDALRRLETILPWPEVLYTRLDRATPAQRLSLSIACAQFINTDIFIFDGVIAHPTFPDAFLQYIGFTLPQIIHGRLAIFSSRQVQVFKALATNSLLITNAKLILRRGVDVRLQDFGSSELPQVDAELADEDLELL